jgi:RNA polymerase sigma factor (sigma-70 family)
MTTALSVAPSTRTGREQALIAAVRCGNDRAFEELYAAYRARIQSYVLGMVGDHGRAEDVTQEVFISALRRIRETERPIAFKAWIYEIAKNACIDQARRSRRRLEVPLTNATEGTGGEVDGLLGGAAHRHLALAGLPDAAVQRKQDLADLCGAFGGLSEAHHQVLVMRELEGRSYAEIGEQLGMSRQVVESTLFRARRKLCDEYEEIASGRRCEQVQAVIDARSGERARAFGVRERRRLARHLAYCQPCRRHAYLAGFDEAQLRPTGLAERIAALLPIPWLSRLLRGADPVSGRNGVPTLPYSPSTIGLVDDVTRLVEGGWPAVVGRAAAAVVAVALAGAGTDLVTHGIFLPSHSSRSVTSAPPAAAGVSPIPTVAGAQAAATAWSAAARTVSPQVLSGSSSGVRSAGAGGPGLSATGSGTPEQPGAVAGGRPSSAVRGSATRGSLPAPAVPSTGAVTSAVPAGSASQTVGAATGSAPSLSLPLPPGGVQGGGGTGLAPKHPVKSALGTATGTGAAAKNGSLPTGGSVAGVGSGAPQPVGATATTVTSTASGAASTATSAASQTAGASGTGSGGSMGQTVQDAGSAATTVTQSATGSVPLPGKLPVGG